jgi:hypothetical protein
VCVTDNCTDRIAIHEPLQDSRQIHRKVTVHQAKLEVRDCLYIRSLKVLAVGALYGTFPFVSLPTWSVRVYWCEVSNCQYSVRRSLILPSLFISPDWALTIFHTFPLSKIAGDVFMNICYILWLDCNLCWSFRDYRCIPNFITYRSSEVIEKTYFLFELYTCKLWSVT